jgi:prepilin-type N-terminal cleavage/methylation domain-containing protein
MSSSRRAPVGGQEGFSLVELVVGLALLLVIACAALALWTGLERGGASDGDKMILLLQSRVAIARLERDVRMATAQDCLFTTSGAVLEAKPNQLVILTRIEQSGGPVLVEWELINGNLMRRRGACPAMRPLSFSHSLYSDNKTMLEGVTPATRLRYFVGGLEIEGPVALVDLPLIDEVQLAGGAAASGVAARIVVAGGCLVGR